MPRRAEIGGEELFSLRGFVPGRQKIGVRDR